MTYFGYSWLYLLPVGEEFEPGWYRLKWRPIKNGNWNLYTFTQGPKWWFHRCYLGIKLWDGGTHNGWGRGWDGRILRIGFWFYVYRVLDSLEYSMPQKMGRKIPSTKSH